MLIVFALITATISPACAFTVNAKGYIEICAADGTIKRIAVTDRFNPLAEQQKQNSSHHAKDKQCDFCMFDQSVNQFSTATIPFTFLDIKTRKRIVRFEHEKETTLSNTNLARGPPSILLV